MAIYTRLQKRQFSKRFRIEWCADMARIVQKFGGTSVGDIVRIKNVAQRVKAEVDRGNQVAVACIDAQRHLELNVAQTGDIGQGGPQIGIGADIGKCNQEDYTHQDHTNARDEN